MTKNKTLKQQFIIKMLLVVVSIATVSGLIQFYFLYQEVKLNVENEAQMISQSIEQGIKSTDLAERAIEQQIDYKIESISQRISERLPNKEIDITNQVLQEISKDMNITGISIFAKENDKVTVFKSSEPEEIGFSLEGLSKEGDATLHQLLNEVKPENFGITSYINDNTVVLYTAQAGSRDKPEFFKYAYYHKPGTDYIISIFIEANEVYQYTEKVGPHVWIENLLKENEYAKEIAVLNPRVYADPSLAEKIYPPLEKVVYGKYNYTNDEKAIIRMIEHPEKTSYLQDVKGEKIYKIFIPYDEGRVIFIALDYEKMSAPLKNHSLILIIFGFLSLIVLFFVSTRFFSGIYRNIEKIIKQIKSLEKGDFTVQSTVNGGGELDDLSKTTNKMAITLNNVMSETLQQANHTQKLAYILEAEATKSVEEIYTISMQTTSGAREITEDLEYSITQIITILQDSKDEKAKVILAHIEEIRQYVKKGTNSATEMTISLANILTSLQNQSVSLSTVSKKLFNSMKQFELDTRMDEEEHQK
ncbi:methyl-accepting chemotaxis protein [Psychrobacillus sp. PGGUH221]|uniref:methyl-accepting chemotaxis protein n=1 Tax=Psychrobacillus sp. PGGUH221 TaxID=3020058 RepID=UPI0035C6ABA0